MIELLGLGIATNQKRAAKWTKEEENKLVVEAGSRTVLQLEALLGKTSGSLYRKASELGISLNSNINQPLH